ncbi:MAG: hypothetical protein KIT09_31425 [Bryobacteraceae bacterium]|nr:hypothetical protein [Bryobacteraceae bacterium]
MPLDRFAQLGMAPAVEPLVMPFGANLPFLYYGDVGCNAWGCRGLATEGFTARQGFVDLKRVATNPFTGRQALAISANMAAQSAQSAGEVSTEPAVSMPAACPNIPSGTLLDLEGVTVHYRLCFPAGSAGPEGARNFVQFFAKSRTGNEFPSLYSDPVAIDPAWESKCVDLELRVATNGPGRRFGPFDAARIAEVGFKVAVNAAIPGATLRGDLYLERLAIDTNPPIVYDFEMPLVERQFRAIGELSARLSPAPPLVRVFALVDGRAGIVWDAGGRPQGLDDFVFRDLDALVAAAESAQVRLILVLLDFHWAARASVSGGVQLGGRANVIREAALRRAFVANILEPVLSRYGNHPSIYAWEIMNEPEWVVSGIPGFRPDARTFDPVPLNDMREFFRACAEAIRRLTRHEVTVGSARRSWLSLWKETGVTIHSWHYYDSDTEEPFPWRPKADLRLDAPVLVTEAPTAATTRAAGDYLRAARLGGYDALCLWSCRAQDAFSNFPAAAADLAARVPELAAVVNAAGFENVALAAPDSWLTVFGTNLAPAPASAAGALPTTLGGVAATITDSAGAVSPALLSFVSPGQINCLLPAGIRTGAATLVLSRIDGGAAAFNLEIGSVAPGLFTANADGKGVAAALIARVSGGRVTATEPVFACGATGRDCRPRPFLFGPPGERAVLILFATGIRGRSGLSAVAVRIGGRDLAPEYAGPQLQFPGLDQVNVMLPRDLAGGGLLSVELVVDGFSSNAGSILIE